MKSDKIVTVTLSLALIGAVIGVFVPYFMINVATATFVVASTFFYLNRKPEKEVIIKEVEKEPVATEETRVKPAETWDIAYVLKSIKPSASAKQPANKLFEILSEKLELVQGCLYTVGQEPDGTKIINVTSSYAYYSPDRLEKFDWGEGLVGAAISDNQPLHLKNLPAGYITIASGLGESKSGELLIIPLVDKHEVQGALEFAFFKPLTEHQVNELKKLSHEFLSTIQPKQTEELA